MTHDTRQSSVDTDLLIRHLAGQVTPAESDAVEQWLTADPSHAETLAALARALRARPHLLEAPNADQAWRQLEARLATAPEPNVTLVREWPLGPRRRVRVPWAAAAALAIAAGAAWWVVAPRLAQSGAESRAWVVSAPPGKRLSFQLPDGALVTLAPGSTLRASPHYGVRDRRVELDGEAAFTVAHDPIRPFEVHTARAIARDLGTRFAVRAYGTDAIEQVVVAAGKVQVSGVPAGPAANPGAPSLPGPIELTRGQLARVDQAGVVTVRSRVDVDRYFAWVEGRLVFRDTPLAEAAARLSRWYDVDVRLASDRLGSLPLTASFAEQPAAEALRVIALTQIGRAHV